MSKEALFNILNNHFDFDGLKVLDLFSGTDFGCVKFIKQTAAEYDFAIAAIKSDVFAYIDKCNVDYDLIFADPPYGLDQATFEKLVVQLFEKNMLRPDGMLIVEHSKHTKMAHLNHYSFQKNYGGSTFSFFELAKENEV